MWRNIKKIHLGSCHVIKCRNYILGIETSCDDTAAALISLDGKILSENIISQNSVEFGGIIPSYAMAKHSKALPIVVKNTLNNFDIQNLTAIAITSSPGLQGSLSSGVEYAKYLSLKYKVPLIPINHMEAHALTPRMLYPELSFPFGFLLISGGHCILGLAQDIKTFYIFGSANDSPGEALDKISRNLGLNSILPRSGGGAIEFMAKGGDSKAFNVPLPLKHYKNCMFSFSGLKTWGLKNGSNLPSNDLKTLKNFCASFQYGIGRHISMRLQRYFEFLQLKSNEYDGGKKFVVSGGVACNGVFRNMIDSVAFEYATRTYYPPMKYCTDNGAMIAWNGLEKYRKNVDILKSPEEILNLSPSAKEPFGILKFSEVEKLQIKCKWIIK